MTNGVRVMRLLALPVIALALSLMGAHGLYAQVDTGAIQGTVKDPSGAVIPGAKLTLTNEGTNLTLSTTTDASGNYIFTPVRIGSYKISAEFQGFQTSTRSHVVVQVQQQVVANFSLQPGQVTQTVEVTGAPPPLQTQNASVGQVIGSREVNDLPLNGRNFTFLAQLSAGVNVGQPDGRGLDASGTFSANGTRPAQNNYLLDGMDNNADLVDFLNGTSYVVLPPVDAIQEFKVQTSDYSAEFGRAGGAILNATIKSGTNQYHGDAWEFLRNSGLDAANFFENSGNQPKGEFRQNQFGFTIGGPVTVPHIYNGKDKTFFFFDYQGTRIRQASPWVTSVPTAQERASGYTDLSQLIAFQSGTRTNLLGQSFPLGTVFDPATTRPVTQGQVDPVTGLVATGTGFVRDPFPGNQLPAGRIDPNAIKLLNLYPLPTTAGIFNNFTSDPIINDNVDQFDARVDHNFSDKDQMFGRVSFSNEPKFIPGPFTGIADGGGFNQGDQTAATNNDVLSETHAFSPTLINEARIGFTRIGTSRVQPFANNISGIPAQYGIQGIPQVPLNGGLPAIGIGGLNTLGSNAFLPSVEYNSTIQATENLTKVYNNHTFKGGFEFQHIKFSTLQPPWSRGQFNFDGNYTSLPNAGDGSTGMAQLLLTPTAATVPNGINNVGGADNVFASNIANTDDGRQLYGAYFNDDWKMTPNLTVNLGLRWDYFGQVYENYGAQANFVPGAPGSALYLIPTQRCGKNLSTGFQSTMATDGISIKCTSNQSLGNSQLSNFSPRVGFAYQITPKLVVRAGAGMFYDGFENRGYSPNIGENYPFQFQYHFQQPDPAHPVVYPGGTSIATVENGFTPIPLTPLAVLGSGLNLEGIQYNYQTPYTVSYNFTFEYQLSQNQTISLGYVGNVVYHLETFVGSNETSVILPVSYNPQLYVPFPDFGRGQSYDTTQGNSHYNSLQANYERRFSNGLSLLANFTYSSCMTDAYDLLNGTQGTGYRAPYLPGFGIQGDYSICNFETPKVFHLSGGYELPFGNGKHFLTNATGALNALAGGWDTNFILTEQNGQPFGIGCPIATTSNFGCNALLTGQSIYAGPNNVNQWMNPGAFANPIPATTVSSTDFAALGGQSTQLLGPGFHRLDFSLFKEIKTTETTHLEFRAEVFNIFNTPQFSFPAFTDFTNTATFGRITSVRDGAYDQREIQFALKFYF
jgi:hypothetical protein